MTIAQLDRARRLLCELQDVIAHAVHRAQSRERTKLADVAAVTTADTIFKVDKITEATVLAWFEAHWPRQWPVELVMEGLEDSVAAATFPRGTPVSTTVFKCILDPIDGTRGLMYDKRSAWSLGALAPQRGERTNTGDLLVAAMTELPVTKQSRRDQFSVVRGQGIHATRFDAASGRKKRFQPRPSQAMDLVHGFASFSKFFPPGKTWLATLEERLWKELKAGPHVFDDQYLSSGGQLHELLSGHDRFTADLRPLAFAACGIESSLACHPYDICTALIAEEAGCVILGADGKALRVPLDTTTPVAWVGYANPSLARWIGPKLRALLR